MSAGTSGPAQQCVVEQVDLADREVVRGAPVAVEPGELVGIEWCGGDVTHGRVVYPSLIGEKKGPRR